MVIERKSEEKYSTHGSMSLCGRVDIPKETIRCFQPTVRVKANATIEPTTVYHGFDRDTKDRTVTKNSLQADSCTRGLLVRNQVVSLGDQWNTHGSNMTDKD